MNCKEAQSDILLFLQGKLDIEELEHFLKHIESCSVCREELKVYYTLYAAMRILEENLEYEYSNDQINLERELARAKEQCRRARWKRIEKNLLFIIASIMIGVFII